MSEQMIVEARIQAPPEGEKVTGKEWLVTIIGPDTPEDLVTIGGQEYVKSKNGRLYSAAALAKSAPMWNGVKVYDNHLTDEDYTKRRGQRSVVKEWLGSLRNPFWNAQERKLQATLKVVDGELAAKLLSAHESEVLDTVGLSIDTKPIWGEVSHEGRVIPTVVGFEELTSLDVVANPAAGGRFERVTASQTDDSKESIVMTKEEFMEFAKTEEGAAWIAELNPPVEEAEEVVEAEVVEEAVEEAEEEEVVAEAAPEATPDATEARVRKIECKILLKERLDAAKLTPALRRTVESAFDGRVFDVKELNAVIKTAKTEQAAGDESGKAKGSPSQEAVQVGIGPQDRFGFEMLRLLMGNTDFKALEHASESLVQERVPAEYKMWRDHGRPNYGTTRLSEMVLDFVGDPLIGAGPRLTESISTATLTSVMKNTLNLMLANDYSQRERWWEPIVRTEDVDSIQDATLVRTFGMNTLAVVDEGAAYTELLASDQEETASFVKRGNYVGITMEALMKDRIAWLRSIPARLANSWYNTLSDRVSAVFTTNTAAGPVLADSGALFNAVAVGSVGGHANLLTTALSYSSFEAARLAMMKQTDQASGAGRRVGIQPKYLLTAFDNAPAGNLIANNEFRPTSANRDENPYKGRVQVIEVPPWTDTDNWALVADPQVFPAIWLFFYRGKRVPELFTASDETSGAQFTNDVLRYKVRMLSFRYSSTYDCAPVSDFRPLHKSNV